MTTLLQRAIVTASRRRNPSMLCPRLCRAVAKVTVPSSPISRYQYCHYARSATAVHSRCPVLPTRTLYSSALAVSPARHLTLNLPPFRVSRRRFAASPYSPSPSPSSLFDRASSFIPSPSTRPYVVWLLVGLNVAVFVLWRLSAGSPQSERLLIDHFTVSLRSLSAGRLHTLITAAFSQQDFTHLLFNCLALYVFGTELALYLGTARFLLVYFGGAVTSSMAHVLYQNYLYPRLVRARQSSQRQPYPYNMYSQIAAQRPYAFDRPAMGAR